MLKYVVVFLLLSIYQYKFISMDKPLKSRRMCLAFVISLIFAFVSVRGEFSYQVSPGVRSETRSPESMILQPPNEDDDQDELDSMQKTPWSYSQVLRQEERCSEKNLLACSTDCDHYKVHRKHGCCECFCSKNYLLVGSTECHRASWSKWSSWSECIKTKWGGLQTRERICKSRGREAAGSCAGRGSMSRTCSSVTGEFRIRKNVRHLTNEDTHDLIQAMTKFKKDKSKKGYMNIASWHGWPGRCPWYKMYKDHEDGHCSWHHHPLFLPWHRMIIVQFELGLQRYLKNKTLGIPFWDWTEKALDIPYLIRLPEIYDPILKKYVHNPFHGSFIPGTNHTYTRRRIWYPGVLMDNFFQRATTRALLSHDYSHFDRIISSYSHDQIHNCFCYKAPRITDPKNWCDYGMLATAFSAFDPTFLLHHSAMDRTFAMRRHLEKNARVSDWTSSRVTSQFLAVSVNISNPKKHSFEWPLAPFCNKSMNPETTTSKNKVWTLHRSYYNEQMFGYKYADFNLGKYSWRDLNMDFKYNNLKRKFWMDEILETKLGNLGKNFCDHPVFDKSSSCYFSC
uniref:hemocyanin, beta-C chain unit G-like n=1 Tax=Styela clava TaxID=7725 RepID=UPI00193AD1F5|nr:hemocyanin, beta-C chain unit G-like [Styela clava]